MIKNPVILDQRYTFITAFALIICIFTLSLPSKSVSMMTDEESAMQLMSNGFHILPLVQQKESADKMQEQINAKENISYQTQYRVLYIDNTPSDRFKEKLIDVQTTTFEGNFIFFKLLNRGDLPKLVRNKTYKILREVAEMQDQKRKEKKIKYTL